LSSQAFILKVKAGSLGHTLYYLHVCKVL